MQTIKRKVIYKPIHLQGMGMKNRHTILGAIHLTMIVQFYDTNTDLGKLLQTSLEFLMMEQGMPNNPLEYEHIKYSDATTKSWMKHL